jgi:putative membrane protein
MIGWLGESLLWVKAAHLIFVIFWMAGLFMLPRYYIYHYAAQPGSDEDRQWIEREARLRRIIVTPSMVLVWILGLMLAANIGFQGGWLHLKLLIVFALSGYHGWLIGFGRKIAAGQRPISEGRLRLLNEVPALATVVVVVLAVVRPF